MKKTKILNAVASLCIVHCALCIISCSTDDDVDSPYMSDPDAVHIDATIGSPIETRINTGDDGDTWSKGDMIYVKNDSTNSIVGKEEGVFVAQGDGATTTWEPSGEDYVVWAAGKNKFRAYYPYSSSVTSTSYSRFTLPLDQTKDLAAADWMTADTTMKKNEAKTLSLNFKHQMAKVTFQLTPGEEYGTTINVTDNHIFVPYTPDSRITVPDIDSLDKDDTGLDYVKGCYSSSANTITAILPAGSYQKSSNRNPLMALYLGNVRLEILIPTDKTGSGVKDILENGLKSGNAYNFNVTVGKDVMKINSVEVYDWNDGGKLKTGTADDGYVAPTISGSTITLTAAGCLSASDIKKALGSGTELTITGEMNSNDFVALRNFASNLTKLDLSGVTNITELENFDGNGALQSMKSLTEVKLPANCTALGDYAFWNCLALTTINGIDKITEVGDGVFSYCSSLTNIPTNATSVGVQAFLNCTALTEVKMENATSIGSSAFSGCTGLTKVEFPNATTLGSSMFNGCTALLDIHLTAKTFTEVNSSLFSDLSNTNSCTLHLSEGQKVEDGDWYPTMSDGSTDTYVNLYNAFKAIYAGNTQIYPTN